MTTSALLDRPAPPAAPAAPARRYVVKWTDATRMFAFPCESRDLTFEQAARKASNLTRTIRMFRPQVLAKMNVKVAYQCDCGRDVTSFAEPHTVPYTAGERCPVTGPQA